MPAIALSGVVAGTLIVIVIVIVIVIGTRDGGAPASSGPPPAFGAVVQPEAGESYVDALRRSEQRLGRLDALRIFHPGPPDAWPPPVRGRDLVVSFKLDPGEVLAGRWDAVMARWFASAPRDGRTYWVLWHEPEDDIEAGRFHAGEFRRAFARLDRLADRAGNRRLISTVVLMSWTTREGSGRRWSDFVPPLTHVDVLAWDVYNRDDRGYASPESLLGPACAVNEELDKPFAVAELGSVLARGDEGRGRAAWLREMGALTARCGARFVTYFDVDWASGRQDFRLLDVLSLRAWRALSQSRSAAG